MNLEAIVRNAPTIEEACRACASPADVAMMLGSVEGSVLKSPEEAGLMSERDLRDALAAHLRAHDDSRAESAVRALADASRDGTSRPVFVWYEEWGKYRSLNNLAVAAVLGVTHDMASLPPLIGLLPERSAIMPPGYAWSLASYAGSPEYQLKGPDGEPVAWAKPNFASGQVRSSSTATDLWLTDRATAAESLELLELEACDVLGLVPRFWDGMRHLYEHCLHKARNHFDAKLWDAFRGGAHRPPSEYVLAADYLDSYDVGTRISDELIEAYSVSPGDDVLSSLIEQSAISHARADLDLVADDFQERAVRALDDALSSVTDHEPSPAHNAPLSSCDRASAPAPADLRASQRGDVSR